MNAAILLLAALFPHDHWAVGCWPTGAWGGVELRPDGAVVERDPDGNITDLGRWWAVGDEDVYWVFVRAPQQTHTLSSSGDYVIYYGGGYVTPPSRVKRGHVPDTWEDLFVEAFE